MADLFLREWSEKKHLEAMMICRVAGDKPVASGAVREDAE